MKLAVGRKRRSRAGTGSLGWRLRAAAGAMLVVGGGLSIIAVTPAAAASGPDFTLSEIAPSSVLYGTPATVTLTATDTDALGSGDTPGYNLSFEDVLPAGVSYVGGSSVGAGDPTELANEPASGDTTLIWSDVADLQPASSTTLSFNLQGAIDTTVPTPTTILYPGAIYSDSASAYVSNNPRYIPQFASNGVLSNPDGYFSSETASGTTEISPLEVAVTDNAAKHELLRGVHDQQTIWTVTVTNNDVHATALTTIDAWLPAGLEFLGCGDVDNTSDPGTLQAAALAGPPGSWLPDTDEYPGSGSIAAGNGTSGSPLPGGDAIGSPTPPSTPPCLTPTTTQAVSTTPPGLQTTSNESNPVYTDAEWAFGTSAGDQPATTLQAGQTYTFRYLAAVPLQENTLSWPDIAADGDGAGPSATSNDQTANLDNNTGEDTIALSSVGAEQISDAEATGIYQGEIESGQSDQPASANDSDTDTVHDIRLEKSITTTGSGCGTSSATFEQGEVVCFQLDYQTSEYRFSGADPSFPGGVVLVDTLPNGLCPIDSSNNYDEDDNVADATSHAQCAPQSGIAPSLAYSSVTESTGSGTQPADDGLSSDPPAGSFTITWDLGTLPPDTSGSVTFPAVDRTYYQQYSGSFSVSTPTVSGDSVHNFANIAADTYATCVESDDATLDPTCTEIGSSAIYPYGAPAEPGATGDASTGTDLVFEEDADSAEQTTIQPTIEKEIGVPVSGGGGLTCQGASYSTSTTTVFQDGDVVCFQLSVAFSPDSSVLYTRDPVVTDLLPPNSTYDPGDGSGPVSADNTVGICTPVPSGDSAAGSYEGYADNPVVDTSGSDGNLLTWYLGDPLSGGCSGTGDAYALPGQSFAYDVAATINAPPSEGNNFELTQNLMKYTSFNTAGTAIAERSLVGYDIAAPAVTLQKGVAAVDGTAVTNGGTFGSDVHGTSVEDGNSVTMRIDLLNSGEVAANDVTVWDVLSTPVTTGVAITCTAFGLSTTAGGVADPEGGSPAGTCYDGGTSGVPTGVGTQTATVTYATIVWDVTSIAAAASPSSPGKLTLEYTDTVPAATNGDRIFDQAGVVSYIGEPVTDPSEQVTYVPATASCPLYDITSPSSSDGNLDCDASLGTIGGSPTVESAPTPSSGTYVTYPSYVQIPAPTLAKTVWSSNPLGSSPQQTTTATPGQDVYYKLVATVPVGTTLENGSVSDDLGTSSPRLDYVDDSALDETAATATCTGGPLSSSVTVSDDTDVASDSETQSDTSDTYYFTLTAETTAASSGTANSVTLDFPSSISVSGSALVCTIVFEAAVQTVNANERGDILTNTADLAWTYDDTYGEGTGSPVSSSKTVTITEPDLTITKTDGDDGSALPGATVPYTITVTNSTAAGDDSTAYDLTVVDTLPAQEVCVESSVSGSPVFGGGACSGSDAGGTITWTISSLASGASQAYTYSATLPAQPTGSDNYTNTATVSGYSCSLVSAPDGACDSAGREYAYNPGPPVVYPAQHASDTVSVAAASVTKSAAGNVPVGADTLFTDTLTIPANLNFPDLDVVDVLPDGLSFDGYVSASCTAGCSGASDVTATSETPTTHSATGNATSGETAIAWSFGDVSAASAVRTVVLTYDAYPAEDYTASTSLSGAVSPGDQLVNTVGAYWMTVTGDTAPATAPDPSAAPGFGFTRATATVTATVTVLAPHVSITKTPASAQLAPGAEQTYTLVLCNGTYSGSTCTAPSEPTTAYLDTVSDVLPTGESVVAGSISDGGTLSSGTITWDLAGDTLAAGGTSPSGLSSPLTYEVTLGPSSGLSTSTVLTNTATVNGYYATDLATATADTARWLDYGSPSAEATLTPVFPQLSVHKYVGATGTSTSGTTTIGEATSFHAVVTDTTPAGAQDLSVVDTLPAYWSYDSGSTSIVTVSAGTVTADPSISTTGNVETLTWSSLGTLAESEQITLAYQATPEPGATLDTAATNSIVVSGEDGSGATSYGSSPVVPYSASSTAQESVSGADLSVAKHHIGDSNGDFTAGEDWTYTLTVTNHGPDTSDASVAHPIVLTDTLPAGETYVLAAGANLSAWNCSGSSSSQTVTCDYSADLADAATTPAVTLTVAVVSSATGTLTNDASVSPGLTGDPVSSNNSTTDPTTIDTSADLSIEKTLTSPASGLVSGEDATYTLAVANAGPSDAVTPQVQDVLPAGETYVAASGTGWSCANSSGTVTCTAAGNLAAGSSESPISLEVAVASSEVASITNTAVVCSGTIGSGSNACAGGLVDNGTPDPDTVNNTSSAPSSPSVGADLTITKTHSGDFPSGGTGAYTITVSNAGPADSVGPITVVDTLPQYETYLSASGSGWTCSVGTGISSQVVTCIDQATDVANTSLPPISLEVSVSGSSSALGSVTNTAEVTGTTPDPNPANNTASDPTVIAGADLSIAKAAVGSFVAGDQATYSLTVSNAGPAPSAPAVTVSDPLPAGESFVSASGTDWSCSASSGVASSTSSGATMTCSSTAPIPAGGSAPEITLTVALAASMSGAVTNTATVTAGPTVDPNTSNNSASVTTDVGDEAALSIVKSHHAVATLGGRQQYQLAVTNNGPSIDPGPTTVTDPLPRGETYVAASGSGWSCSAAATGSSGTSSAGTSSAGTSSAGTGSAGTGSTGTSSAGTGSTGTGSAGTGSAGTGSTGASSAGAGESQHSSGGRTTVTCTSSAVVPVGSSAPMIDLTVRLGAAAYPKVTNTAIVKSSVPNPDPGGATSSDTVTPRPAATLRITKSLVGALTVGGTATYDISVVDSGPSAASDVAVVDAMPPGLVPLAGSGSGWSCSTDSSASSVACHRSALAVGAPSVITVTAHVVATAGATIANQARVTSSPPPAKGSVTSVVTPPAAVAGAPATSTSTTSTSTSTSTTTSTTPASTTPSSTPPSSTTSTTSTMAPSQSTLPPSTVPQRTVAPPSTSAPTTTVTTTTAPATTTPPSSSSSSGSQQASSTSSGRRHSPGAPAKSRRVHHRGSLLNRRQVTAPTVTDPVRSSSGTSSTSSSSGLAFTGLDLLPIAVLGLGLMLLGTALVSLTGERRRRRRTRRAS